MAVLFIPKLAWYPLILCVVDDTFQYTSSVTTGMGPLKSAIHSGGGNPIARYELLDITLNEETIVKKKLVLTSASLKYPMSFQVTTTDWSVMETE